MIALRTERIIVECNVAIGMLWPIQQAFTSSFEWHQAFFDYPLDGLLGV